MSPIKVDKKPKPPSVPPPVSPPPPPPTWQALGAPAGTIGGPLKIAYGRGADWSQVNRYDPLFIAAGEKHDVPPAMLKAMAVIESGGQMIPNQGGSGAYGIMQIKPDIWGSRAKKLGYDLMTPAGQIGMAAAMLGGDVPGVSGSTPKERFLANYYPTPGLDIPGEDGHTPRQYLSDMDELMRQINAAGGAGAPPEAKHVDIIDAIMGGAEYTDDYGYKSPTDLPYYSYFVGHGGQSNQHTGIDVMASLGLPLFSPISGTVVCAGTGVGAGAYGSSCAAFGYTLGANTGSSGRIEILDDDGKRSLILGHCIRTTVPLGSRVKPGVHIGDLGGMNGPHVHVECRIWDHGNYTIVDPRAAYGKVPYSPPIERVPYNFDPASQPAPNQFTVKALKKLSVYQRADPKAAILDTIEKGDTFQAIAMVPGNDGKPWYLGLYNGRVPTDGTEIQ